MYKYANIKMYNCNMSQCAEVEVFMSNCNGRGNEYSIEDIKLTEALTSVIPSKSQMEWQGLEFTAFFHYGINSFTNREWGDGKEDISVFNPSALNTDQWCRALLKAQIKGCIITAKHHDGFCLWDTKYTTHSVMHTPFGKDIVKMLSDSCRNYNIKLGIYLSPWDRHEKTYGMGKEYDDYFCNQLTELLSNYGDIYTVWFDGACGEGPNGKKQAYDWDRYYSLIRSLQPNAVISVSGPDVRWCGNEAGVCREAEWSVVPKRLFSQKAIAQASQQSEEDGLRLRTLNESDSDLGSWDIVKNEKSFIWYPAEVDTSIRPGWFYHREEDCKVRPLEELKKIYLNSIGGNSVLLLNIPPHYDGYITEYDVARLEEIGDFIKSIYQTPVSPVEVKSSFEETDCKAINVLSSDDSYWRPADYCQNAELVFYFDGNEPVSYIILSEKLDFSQRVEQFEIFADGKSVYKGATIGYKKIVALNQLKCNELRVAFYKYRKCPVIKNVLFYS